MMSCVKSLIKVEEYKMTSGMISPFPILLREFTVKYVKHVQITIL